MLAISHTKFTQTVKLQFIYCQTDLKTTFRTKTTPRRCQNTLFIFNLFPTNKKKRLSIFLTRSSNCRATLSQTLIKNLFVVWGIPLRKSAEFNTCPRAGLSENVRIPNANTAIFQICIPCSGLSGTILCPDFIFGVNTVTTVNSSFKFARNARQSGFAIAADDEREDRTKCWTEAPDGPFRNGSRVGGGSVNIDVLIFQCSMTCGVSLVEISAD